MMPLNQNRAAPSFTSRIDLDLVVERLSLADAEPLSRLPPGPWPFADRSNRTGSAHTHPSWSGIAKVFVKCDFASNPVSQPAERKT
jgi:hypothetical protein